MTTKTKMSNLESYQELSIQIACLSMKIDKVLELLNKPEEGVEFSTTAIGDKQLSYEDWEVEYK